MWWSICSLIRCCRFYQCRSADYRHFQLGKLFGVNTAKSEHHYETVYNTLLAAMQNTPWPTFWMALLALTLMLGMKRYVPKLPNVLVAVAATTLLSWITRFELAGSVVGRIPEGLPGSRCQIST